jgi:hypothetical protein
LDEGLLGLDLLFYLDSQTTSLDQTQPAHHAIIEPDGVNGISELLKRRHLLYDIYWFGLFLVSYLLEGCLLALRLDLLLLLDDLYDTLIGVHTAEALEDVGEVIGDVVGDFQALRLQRISERNEVDMPGGDHLSIGIAEEHHNLFDVLLDLL